MMEVFDEIVGPAAQRFMPDIILVSAIPTRDEHALVVISLVVKSASGTVCRHSC